MNYKVLYPLVKDPKAMNIDKTKFNALANGTSAEARETWPAAEKECSAASIDIGDWCGPVAQFKYLVECMRDTTLECGPTAEHKT